MKNPSTADSREPSGLPVDSATDPTLARRSTTHRNVKGETAPRLPHERDQSSDSQQNQGGSAEQGRKGMEDVERGVVDTDRGPEIDRVYNEKVRR